MRIDVALSGFEEGFVVVVSSDGWSMHCRTSTAVTGGASGRGEMHCMMLTAVCGRVRRGARVMALELMVQPGLCRFRCSNVVGADMVRMMVFPEMREAVKSVGLSFSRDNAY
jgi:hypothetical protein